MPRSPATPTITTKPIIITTNPLSHRRPRTTTTGIMIMTRQQLPTPGEHVHDDADHDHPHEAASRSCRAT